MLNVNNIIAFCLEATEKSRKRGYYLLLYRAIESKTLLEMETHQDKINIFVIIA